MRKIYVGDFPLVDKMEVDDFSNDKYICVALFKTHDEKTVLIGRGNNIIYPYMVTHGLSTVVFRTYDDAYNYCVKRFIKVKTLGDKKHE